MCFALVETSQRFIVTIAGALESEASTMTRGEEEKVCLCLFLVCTKAKVSQPACVKSAKSVCLLVDGTFRASIFLLPLPPPPPPLVLDATHDASSQTGERVCGDSKNKLKLQS